MMAIWSLHFGHKRQDKAQEKTEQDLQILSDEFHKNADQGIRIVRKINKKLSETPVDKIYKASHVR